VSNPETSSGLIGAPTLSYQWSRGADDIAGATTRVYVLDIADVGFMVGYRVTATSAGSNTSARRRPSGSDRRGLATAQAALRSLRA
jgi:hypothetical protein